MEVKLTSIIEARDMSLASIFVTIYQGLRIRNLYLFNGWQCLASPNVRPVEKVSKCQQNE
jgi:hypothetical protein